jgi:hypothetical protein
MNKTRDFFPLDHRTQVHAYTMPTNTQMITPQTEPYSYLLQHLCIPNVSTSHSTTRSPPVLPIAYPSPIHPTRLVISPSNYRPDTPTRYTDQIHRPDTPTIDGAPMIPADPRPPAPCTNHPLSKQSLHAPHVWQAGDPGNAGQCSANHWARSSRFARKCYVTGKRERGRWEAWGVAVIACVRCSGRVEEVK